MPERKCLILIDSTKVTNADVMSGRLSRFLSYARTTYSDEQRMERDKVSSPQKLTFLA